MFCQRWVAWALFKDNLFNCRLIMSHSCPGRLSNAGSAWYKAALSTTGCLTEDMALTQ